MPHPFLLSYAWSDSRILGDSNGVDPHFQTFVQRLNMRVNHLTGETGFIDRNDIKPGQDWDDELAEALRTSRTMVCLYSPSYFLSEYCGKEMQVLLDRRRQYIQQNGGKKPANIIPVIWHPVPNRIPRTLPQIEYKSPNLNDPKDPGAWYLGEEEKKKKLKLERFADEIAIRVRDAADETELPPLSYRPYIGAIPNAFAPPPLPLPEFDSPEASAGPAAVTFVYAAGKQWKEWPWAPPEDRAVLHLASAVAKGKEMEASQLAFDAGHSDMLDRLQSACQRNNVVIFLVDAASLSNEGLCLRMKDYDCQQRQQGTRVATVIVWNKNRGPALETKVFDTFDYCAKHTPYFISVEGRDEFSDAVSQTLDALRSMVINDPYDPNRIRKTTNFSSLPTVTGAGQTGLS